MKTLNLALSFVALMSVRLLAQPGQEGDSAHTAQSKSLIVPLGKGQSVAIDGKFSQGEWEDALSCPLAGDYTLYLKADSQALYIGLKSTRSARSGGCEVRMTENGKDVRLLHVSCALGEGLSGFPASRKFEMGNITNWTSNLVVENLTKLRAWEAAGQPVERYGDVIEEVEVRELRIRRKMFSGTRVKLTINWIEFAADGTRDYNFPEKASLQNADNWVELILPSTASE